MLIKKPFKIRMKILQTVVIIIKQHWWNMYICIASRLFEIPSILVRKSRQQKYILKKYFCQTFFPYIVFFNYRKKEVFLSKVFSIIINWTYILLFKMFPFLFHYVTLFTNVLFLIMIILRIYARVFYQ